MSIEREYEQFYHLNYICIMKAKKTIQVAKITFFLFLALYLGCNASAQERGVAWGAFGSSETINSTVSAISMGANAGYNFNPAISLFLQTENKAIVHGKSDEHRSYMLQTLGALFKFNAYRFNSGILDLRASVGSSIFNKDRHLLYYNFGVYLQATRDYTKPTIGIGLIKYQGLKGEAVKSPSLYISIGFTVN